MIMIKTYFKVVNVTIFLFVLALFSSCNKNGNAIKGNNMSQLIENEMSLGQLHNQIMSFTYEKYVKTNRIRTMNNNDLNTVAEKIVIDYFNNDENRTGLAKNFNINQFLNSETYKISYQIKKTIEMKSNGFATKSVSDTINFPEYALKFITFMETMDIAEIGTIDEFNDKVIDYASKLGADYDNNPQIQEAISITAAIFINSYDYWSSNIQNWKSGTDALTKSALTDTVITSSTVTDTVTTENFWHDLRLAALIAANADAESALMALDAAAITTAISGGTLAAGAATGVAVSAAIGSIMECTKHL